MDQKLIDEKFNEFIWEMFKIEDVSLKDQIRLKIAFQEGLILGLNYVIKKWKSESKN